jgi:putative membrane protein
MWNYGHPGYMYDGSWFWGMGLHGLFWLVFLALVIVAGVALVRYLWRSASPARPGASETGASPRQSALETLYLRYARGEIERDEYLVKKKDLGE